MSTENAGKADDRSSGESEAKTTLKKKQTTKHFSEDESGVSKNLTQKKGAAKNKKNKNKKDPKKRLPIHGKKVVYKNCKIGKISGDSQETTSAQNFVRDRSKMKVQNKNTRANISTHLETESDMSGVPSADDMGTASSESSQEDDSDTEQSDTSESDVEIADQPTTSASTQSKSNGNNKLEKLKIKKVKEITRRAINEDDVEGRPHQEQSSETENADAALKTEPIKKNTSGVQKRQKHSADGEGPSQKILKSELVDLPISNPAKLYLAAEHAEMLMREKKKFSEAQTALMRVGRTSAMDYRFKLLLAECKLRLGLVDDTKQAIADVADFIKSKSSFTSEELSPIVSDLIKNKKLGKAMVLLASHAHVLAEQPNIKNKNQAVFEIASCIKSFSDAVRAIPDKKRNERKNAAKNVPTQPPLEKRFGVWYHSFGVFNPIMDDMLAKLRSLCGNTEGKTSSSEAYALNWMSSASYYVQKRDQGLAYSQEGVNILQKRGGDKYHTTQSYADLLHNLGKGTAMCGDVKTGLVYLENSLNHKQNDVIFDSDRKKEASINSTKKSIKYWG